MCIYIHVYIYIGRGFFSGPHGFLFWTYGVKYGPICKCDLMALVGSKYGPNGSKYGPDGFFYGPNGSFSGPNGFKYGPGGDK